MKKRRLTLEILKSEAQKFAKKLSVEWHSDLYGITDGKAIGTALEREFKQRLKQSYEFEEGNAAIGIDFPGLNVDMKTTKAKQPQSSSPFKEARQKVYGLGYSLLVFVYDKIDDVSKRKAKLEILHVIFVEADRTGDFQTTKGILDILNREGNVDDIKAFLLERNLPVDEIGAQRLAEEIVQNPPKQGYLTVSTALQWRLQYSRAIKEAGAVDGLEKLW